MFRLSVPPYLSSASVDQHRNKENSELLIVKSQRNAPQNDASVVASVTNNDAARQQRWYTKAQEEPLLD